jgi:hypothetical protein
MSKGGYLCIWQNSLERIATNSINYHWADRNNRMYLCNCMRGFRIGQKVKYPRDKRLAMTKMQRERKYR